MSRATGWCIVQGCPGRQHDTYHKFPEDEVLCDKWLALVKSPKSKKPILDELSSRVCSLHFADDDYGKKIEPGGLILESLKPTAIPSIFPWTESWPLYKKKKKTEGVNENKPPESQKKVDATTADQTFGCPSCDFTTTNVRSWQNHRRNHEEPHRHWCYQCNYSTDSLDHLEIHLSRDHSGFTNEGRGASPVPKRRTSAANTSSRASNRLKALKAESGNNRSSTGPDSSESDDFDSTIISSSESIGPSSSDSGIHTSATSMMPKASGTPSENAINIEASVKGIELDQSLAAKREVDTTPIVLDIGSSCDEEEADEMIQMSETAVKKETEAGEAKEDERKIIWVLSGTADN